MDNNISKDTLTQNPNALSDDQQEQVNKGPEPNIIFVGKSEPRSKINNGMETYKLPKVEDQATVTEEEYREGSPALVKVYTGKPFYHKNAGQIVQLFPEEYKLYNPLK